MKTILSFLSIFLILIFFLVFWKAYTNQAFSLHFVDEEENFIQAKYILQGEILYSDLFSNHQPLTYFLSAGVQTITDPNSIFLLIKRHREGVIIWAFLWWMILALRFGFLILPLMILYELSKIYLLGNLFLAETFSTYPLVYLVLSVLKKRPSTSLLELFCQGLLIGLIIFLLAPLWPLTLFLFGLIVVNQKMAKLKSGLIVFSGIVVVILALSKFISWPGYFYQAIYTNLKYFYPIATAGEPMILNLFRSFLAPVISYFPDSYHSPILWIIRIVSAVLIFNVIFLIRKQQYYYAVVIFLILGLSNIRFVMPGSQYYQGFHLLPWYILLITTAVFTWFVLFKSSFKIIRMFLAFLWMGIFAVVITFANGSLFTKKDIDNEFFINYSTQFSMGEAVKIMKNPGDTLFVAPDEWLVYWQADIKHASKTLGFYAWQYTVPYINSDVHNLFQTSPPVFFYVNNRDVSLKKYFGKYQEIKKDGHDTSLFVLPQKIANLSKEQKDKLRFHNFIFN